MEQQLIATWARVAVGGGQLVMIGWGLRQMGRTSEERNRQLDIMEANQRDQGQALRQIGQALDRQGEVLAELLRRSA